jgi:hypothetical protein
MSKRLHRAAYADRKPNKCGDVLLSVRNGDDNRCFYIHKTDAPIILESVNAHDGLVEALGRMAGFVCECPGREHNRTNPHPSKPCCPCIARAALKGMR